MLLNKAEYFMPKYDPDAFGIEIGRQRAESINTFLAEQNALGWRLVQHVVETDLWYFEKIE
jgi:hypothetical protein